MCLLFMTCGQGRRHARGSEEVAFQKDVGPVQPSFDDSMVDQNIAVELGNTALLHCRVRNLADWTVTWTRHRDLHILTVGLITYTADQRFQIVHSSETGDFALRIKYVRERDSGRYTCQVSTEPMMSRHVLLTIRGTIATIEGPPEVAVVRGNPINLNCKLNGTRNLPTLVLWYHENMILGHDGDSASVSGERSGADVISRLSIPKAQPKDSGTYTCKSMNGANATIFVHVLNSKESVGTQSPSSEGKSLLQYSLLFLTDVWDKLVGRAFEILDF